MKRVIACRTGRHYHAPGARSAMPSRITAASRSSRSWLARLTGKY